MQVEPSKTWWTAAQLAEMNLPDMPGTARAVSMWAQKLGLREDRTCARTKPGRGGGYEYHWSALPAAAKQALLRHAETAKPQATPADVWARYEQMSAGAKKRTELRLATVQDVVRLQSSGMTKNAAVNTAALKHGVSARTIFNWLDLVVGVSPADWLAYLAPSHGQKKGRAKPTAERPFYDYLKSVYLRLAGQSFRECYRDACEKAVLEGWVIPAERTARRAVEREVPRVTRVYAREGLSGLEKCFPAQIRDRSALGAMGAVCADCHKFDVFVSWPDGTVDRPQMVAFMDLYSNKILSWRIDHNPNKVMVMAAFGELVEAWGIPKACQFDNGREFANKWLTGGAPTRFRFKVREEDALGVLPLLGIHLHWARPGRGQSKPIERAFRDIASDVSKDPRFHGAYVGNRPDAKPENYGSRAVPIDQFLAVVDEGIARHNAREGRLTDTANGRSFDQTFDESFKSVHVKRATEEQRRLWLMGSHDCKLGRDSGQITLFGNHYHSDWMSEHPRRRVIARFDPEKLHDGLHVYDIDGPYLGFAECRQKVGFFDVMQAKLHHKRQARIRRAQKALVDAHTPMSVEELAQDKTARQVKSQADLRDKVVSPDFRMHRDTPNARRETYAPNETPELDAAREALVLDFETRVPELKAPSVEPAQARFLRAREILERSERGDHVGEEEARWVRSYQDHPEYQGFLVLFERHGRDGIS